VHAWHLPETQTLGEVHCELPVQAAQAPEAQTCPVAQSLLPEHAPQLPETHASPVAQSEPFVHAPHTPALQACPFAHCDSIEQGPQTDAMHACPAAQPAFDAHPDVPESLVPESLALPSPASEVVTPESSGSEESTVASVSPESCPGGPPNASAASSPESAEASKPGALVEPPHPITKANAKAARTRTVGCEVFILQGLSGWTRKGAANCDTAQHFTVASSGQRWEVVLSGDRAMCGERHVTYKRVHGAHGRLTLRSLYKEGRSAYSPALFALILDPTLSINGSCALHLRI
jgi:hypothetical protein